MTKPAESIDAFTTMLRNALGHRINQHGTSFMDLVADDIVMTFPFAWEGLPSQLNGSGEIAQHLENLSGLISLDEMDEPIVHETTDPEEVIVEVAGRGRGIASGEIYDQRYICVIRTKEGRIVHYKDYWNPLAILRTTHGPAAVDAFLASAPGHG